MFKVRKSKNKTENTSLYCNCRMLKFRFYSNLFKIEFNFQTLTIDFFYMIEIN